ncbi:hypothetical protein [Kitasatospora sp. NPDC057015]|uniref:hypothetical protein n=1 Tax=Kitasatospora sp. NPDC057015 TaxID=3346001 RepID=UPI003624C003
MASSVLSETEAIRRLRAILDRLVDAFEGSFTIEESDEGSCWVVSVAPLRQGAFGFPYR